MRHSLVIGALTLLSLVAAPAIKAQETPAIPGDTPQTTSDTSEGTSSDKEKPAADDDAKKEADKSDKPASDDSVKKEADKVADKEADKKDAKSDKSESEPSTTKDADDSEPAATEKSSKDAPEPAADDQSSDKPDADGQKKKSKDSGDRNQADKQPDADVDVNARSKTDVDARSKTDIDARSKTDIDARSKTDIDARSKTDIDARSKTDVDARSKTDVDARSKTDVDARSKTDIDARSRTDIDARAKANVDVDQRSRQNANRNGASGRRGARISIDSAARFDTDNQNRLVVRSIVRDSVLATAGLQQGDVLVSVLNQPVTTIDDFRTVIVNSNNVERIPVVVLRNNRRQTLYITYREDNYYEDSDRGAVAGNRLGVNLDSRYPRHAIVESVEPDSPADRGGVRAGDWITRINGQKVNSPAHLTELVDQMDPNATMDIDVSRRFAKQLQVTLDEQGAPNRSDDGYNGPRSAARVNIDNDNYDVQGRARVDDNRGALDTGDRDGRVLNRPLRTRARGN